MPFQTPITIATALERMHRHEYVLPAIQREFVWGPDRICTLFDSLMRGYPVGSLLFWHVDGDTVGDERLDRRAGPRTDARHDVRDARVPHGPVRVAVHVDPRARPHGRSAQRRHLPRRREALVHEARSLDDQGADRALVERRVLRRRLRGSSAVSSPAVSSPSCSASCSRSSPS